MHMAEFFNHLLYYEFFICLSNLKSSSNFKTNGDVNCCKKTLGLFE